MAHPLPVAPQSATAILDAMSAGLVIVDASGRVEYANPAALKILGVDFAEPSLAELELGGAGELAQAIRRSLAVGERVDRAEIRLPGTRGSIRVVGYSIQPVENGVTVLCRDITAVKELESRLNDSEALALIAEAAGAIAHEIQNPLAVVCGYLELLRDEVEVGEQGHEYFRRIFAASQRISQVLQAFQEFASGAPNRWSTVGLEDICDEAIEAVGADGRTMPSITVRGAGEQLMRVAPDALRRAIAHLLRNAVEATSPPESIVIEIETREEGICLCVSDSGPGIPAEIRGEVCRPFFSTRAGQPGLGLAVVKRIADQHGGTLRLSDAPSGGTCAQLELPARLQIRGRCADSEQ